MNATPSHTGQNPYWVFVLLILWAFAPSVSATPATTDDLLTFIRALEAPRGYNDYERRIRLAPPQSLTQMRLRDVLQWQKQVRATGDPSTAAGGYQIIYGTLKRLITTYHLDRDAMFNANMQDHLAMLLIAECGVRPAHHDRSKHPRFANCLAGIWAALPLTSGRHRGQSVHRHRAGNKALTSPNTVLSLLAGQTVPTKPLVTLASPSQTQQTRLPQHLAFGAVRVMDAQSVMRTVQGSEDLTPSVHQWTFDPYASQ